MTLDSFNHVYGRTMNPNKLTLTAGGSTGGEGALIRMRGSLLGMCTDIAGSVRVPALCNGNYGLKPTSERIPFQGKTPPGRQGSPSPIFPVIGPQGHSIRDLELFMRVTIDTDPWLRDHTVHSVPWRRVEPPQRPLRLGFILEDPKRPLHPTALRAMTEAKDLLQKAGHEIIEIGVGGNSSKSVPSLYDSAVLAWRFFLLDPEKTPLKFILDGDEPIIDSLIACSFPENKAWNPTLEGLFEIMVERSNILDIYRSLWAGKTEQGVVEQRLDAIILPPYQAPAPLHDLFGVPIYTVLANFLDV
jgi:amidase